jgi:hypothetical protein
MLALRICDKVLTTAYLFEQSFKAVTCFSSGIEIFVSVDYFEKTDSRFACTPLENFDYSLDDR